MATDIFLTLDGIKGESTDDKHKEAIDVVAWSWGLANSGTFHSGTGGGAGKANFQDISVTKYVDKSTADLMYSCASGKHLSKGTLIVRKAGEKPLEYLIYTLEEILVSSVSTGSSEGQERATENVTLNFSKVKMEYKIQDKSGGGKDGGTFTWNIPANVK
jgi:type VI secretion system secreted protein Hcp